MEKITSSSFNKNKSSFSSKITTGKVQNEKSHKQQFFNHNNMKKSILDQQSNKIIKNYFQFNNFQDLNSWQQIAKTKIDYLFEQLQTGKYECTLTMKWQNNQRQNIITKGTSSTKRNAKKKALVSLIQNLINKGLVGFGFKESNFIQKLPRRKKYESSSSEEEQIESKHTKKVTTYSLIKENNIPKIIQTLDASSALQIWDYALFSQDLDLCFKILRKLFGLSMQLRPKLSELKQFSCVQSCQKQVSYVEQSKDPFEEDLTVFIRYYQLQRPKYNIERRRQCGTSVQTSKNMDLPSSKFFNKQNYQLKFDNFKQFCSIQQITDKQDGKVDKVKLKKTEQLKINNFFRTQRAIKIPKFEQNETKETKITIKLIERLFNQIIYASYNLNFSLQVIQLLAESCKEISFGNADLKKDQSKYQGMLSNVEQDVQKKAQQYYIRMKKGLLTQMIYNLNIKQKKSKLGRTLSIQGMIQLATAHTKYQGLFQFTSKEPEQIFIKKVQKKNNFNQFFQQNQFCVNQIVLLVNKVTQQTFIGTIKQLNLSFKIYVPFLQLTESDFPAPFTIFKLINSKIYNKLSLSLLHTCKYYMDYVDPSLNKRNNIKIIYQNPSSNHIEIIEQLLSQWIAKKLFVLIVSQNCEMLHQKLTQHGYKCLTLLISTDQKTISKHNVLCASPLNVCTDNMKNIAFDRLIIDEAHRIPQIISLMSLIKCTKKVYLIGDPNLPRSQMNCPYSKTNEIERSLFQSCLNISSAYFTINKSKVQAQNDIFNLQNTVFDQQIVEWLKNTVYEKDITTLNQQPLAKKTPSIKGFNWPSQQYRLCFLNVKKRNNNIQKYVNDQCFLISWIIAEVLRSGFTQIDQITCCSLISSFIPVLQQYLVKILVKLNIQPLKWGSVFQTLVKPLDGSKFNRNNLVILLASEGPQKLMQNKENNQMGKKLISALLQAKRGLIIVGDIEQLSQKSSQWKNFIDWMGQKNLILSYQQRNLYINQ